MSTSSVTSVWLDSNMPCVAYIAASHPASRPAHSYKHPAAFLISPFTKFITTFPAIPCRTLPTLIDCNPGFLSRGMSLQAKNAWKGVLSLVVST